MPELQYPVGMSTFSELIEEGYVYIDKTAYIKSLLRQGQKCRKRDLISVGFNDRNPIPLMFQTGYLTIGDYNKLTDLYELRFPNREVEIGFYEELLPLYAPATADPTSK